MSACSLISVCAVMLAVSRCNPNVRDTTAIATASATPPSYMSPEYIRDFAEFKRRNMRRVGTTVTAVGAATWWKGQFIVPFDGGDVFFEWTKNDASLRREILKRQDANQEIRVKVTGKLGYCDWCPPFGDPVLKSTEVAIQMRPEYFFIDDANVELLNP
jgi:hypothetical protein